MNDKIDDDIAKLTTAMIDLREEQIRLAKAVSATLHHCAAVDARLRALVDVRNNGPITDDEFDAIVQDAYRSLIDGLPFGDPLRFAFERFRRDLRTTKP